MMSHDDDPGEKGFIDACKKYRTPSEVDVAEKIINWLKDNSFSVRWETNNRNPSQQNMQLTILVEDYPKDHSNVRIVSDGKVRVHTRDRLDPFDKATTQVELIERFESVCNGVSLEPKGWREKIESGMRVDPYFKLSSFGAGDLTRLYNFLEWYRGRITDYP